MKKVFLSLPMSGRGDKEVKEQLEGMKRDILDSCIFDDEEIIFMDNFDYVPLWKQLEHISPDKDDSPISIPLTYLAGAINKIAYANAVFFGAGWEKARGCRIEWDICLKYDIPRYVSRIGGESDGNND